MKQIKLGKTNISVPAIVLGCMRLGALDLKTAEKFIDTALELGINHMVAVVVKSYSERQQNLTFQQIEKNSLFSPNVVLFRVLCMIFQRNTSLIQ